LNNEPQERAYERKGKKSHIGNRRSEHEKL
jgi:hypothetical protein